MSTSRPSLAESDLEVLAAAWRDVDPTVANRRAVDEALAAGRQAIERLFASPLRFGTAGLRGPLGPGPAAMNRVLVRIVARALGQRVRSHGGNHVVIGYDARHQSDVFALDTARVLAAHGVTATLIDTPTPTPVLAFAVRHFDASAGVMVTASHNPRTDNGYKVYGPDGALLSRPADDELAETMLAVPLVADDELADENNPNIRRVNNSLIDEYVEQIVSMLATNSGRTTRAAYTPLHGVGYDVLERAFTRAGFPRPAAVPTQQAPDGNFPTAPFPNPEEPGALRGLLDLASETGADVALANDPDADRLAVATPTDDGWRLLSGDELGCLLAEHLLARTPSEQDRIVMNTVVSSRLLAAVAAHHNVRFEQTLTGFKWIMQAQARADDAMFVMGYEEALGYAIGNVVRDKDGISAALLVAEMVAQLATKGKTLLDALDDLHLRHGVHTSGQRSVRFEANGPTPDAIMSWLRDDPPAELGGHSVVRVQDLQTATGTLPSTNAIALYLNNGRIMIRPSGTEPKLKLYGECWRPAPPSRSDLAHDRAETHAQLASTLTALGTIVCDPERARTSATRSEHDADEVDIETRAAALFATEPKHLTRSQALRLVVESIDLTTLAGDDTDGRVRALCAQARRPDPADPTVGPTAAVCVYPNLVPLAVELNKGSGVAVASVAGAFPSGLSSLEVRLSDIAEAVCAGADEIDVVLNRAAFLAGDDEIVAEELRAMRAQIGRRTMKVILETGELRTPQAIRAASRLAIDAGTDWIKTSTGKSGIGATPTAVAVMAETIAEYPDHPQGVGLKVSGGVRTTQEALGYLAIVEAILGPSWLHPDRVRFGASGLLSVVIADLAKGPQ